MVIFRFTLLWSISYVKSGKRINTLAIIISVYTQSILFNLHKNCFHGRTFSDPKTRRDFAKFLMKNDSNILNQI